MNMYFVMIKYELKTVKFIGYENVGLFRFKLHTGNLEINDKNLFL